MPISHVLVLLAVAVAGHAAGATVEPRAGIAGCTVSTPSGDYALAVIELAGVGAAKGQTTWTYIGGLRGGRMRVDDGVGLREPGGWLELKDGKLTGRFRRVDLGGDVVVEASVAGGALTGSAEVAGKRAALTGRIIGEAELARANAVAKERSWPATQGPIGGGCSAQSTGAATIDDLAGLRPVWRCEESDIGFGMGNITRFMNKWTSASQRRTGSGCAGALVADGRLYLWYTVPAPRPSTTPEAPLPNYGGSEATAAKAMLDEAKKAGFTGDALPGYAHEKIFQCADEIMLCLDAATGKTLWKAVVKDRGVNSQHHKAGYFDMSPALADGRVFALGTSGWLYAFDAASGKPLWEVKSEADGSNALLAHGGVVVAPAAGQWGGYDATTGRLLWTAGKGRAMSTLSAWTSAGRTLLIGIMGPNHARAGVAALDAATGKELWKLPINIMTGGRGLGPGGLTVSGDVLLAYQDAGSAAKDAEPKPVLSAWRLGLDKAEPLWQLAGRSDGKGADEDGGGGKYGCVHNESVPVVVNGRFVFTPDLRTIDLASGKAVGQGKGVQPGNGGYMQAIEDLVVVRRDGTHGGMDLGFYKVAADGSVRALNTEPWTPPVGGSTTSYHHPIFYPMVDGRMFARQGDGIYCWDLRAAKR